MLVSFSLRDLAADRAEALPERGELVGHAEDLRELFRGDGSTRSSERSFTVEAIQSPPELVKPIVAEQRRAGNLVLAPLEQP